MKKFLVISLIALFSMTMHAQKVEYVYTEAADLTLIGKLMRERHRILTIVWTRLCIKVSPGVRTIS